MLKIEKIVSEQYLPLTKQNNLINFVINQEGTHMDMTSSYIQFTLNVTGGSATMSFGQDGMAYYPICMIRRCRLVSSTVGTLMEVNNLNILMQNLLWYNKTTSENLSDSLFGWGAVEGHDYTHSVFSDYPDNSTNCCVKLPFKHLFPGSIGNDQDFPTDKFGTLTIMMELEPTKNLFMQITDQRWSIPPLQRFVDMYAGTVNFNDLDSSGNVLTVASGGSLDGIQVGSYVTVSYTDVDGLQGSFLIVIAKDETTVTLNDELPVCTGVDIEYSNILIQCLPYTENSTQSTLTVPNNDATVNNILQQFQGMIPDLTPNGTFPLQCLIQYATYLTAGGPQTSEALITTITNAVQNEDNTVTITINPPMPAAPANSTVSGIRLGPYNTNLPAAAWTVTNAYCFPYRKYGKPEGNSKICISYFTYEPLPFVSDGNSFAREIQITSNAYNVFLICPPVENISQLYSSVDGITDYRFFLDDIALTNIQIPLNTTVDLDMKTRVFNNSTFLLRNLSLIKNEPEFYGGNSLAQVYCAKVKPKMVLGDVNYTADTQRRNLRVEINGVDMPTAKTIYFFKEEYKLV